MKWVNDKSPTKSGHYFIKGIIDLEPVGLYLKFTEGVGWGNAYPAYDNYDDFEVKEWLDETEDVVSDLTKFAENREQ